MQIQGWVYIVSLKKYTEMGADYIVHEVLYFGFFHLMHLISLSLSGGIEFPHSFAGLPMKYYL